MAKLPMAKADKPTPGTRTTMSGPPDGPVMRGEGDISYTCSGCERVLVEGVEHDQVRDIVFHCKACGSYSDIPMSAIFR